jgi:hypothetical protein
VTTTIGTSKRCSMRFSWRMTPMPSSSDEGDDVDLGRDAGENLGNQHGVRGLVVDYEHVLAHGLP